MSVTSVPTGYVDADAKSKTLSKLDRRNQRGWEWRVVLAIVNEALVALERDFSALYSPIGRP
jgi:hypothetical protein